MALCNPPDIFISGKGRWKRRGRTESFELFVKKTFRLREILGAQPIDVIGIGFAWGQSWPVLHTITECGVSCEDLSQDNREGAAIQQSVMESPQQAVRSL